MTLEQQAEYFVGKLAKKRIYIQRNHCDEWVLGFPDSKHLTDAELIEYAKSQGCEMPGERQGFVTSEKLKAAYVLYVLMTQSWDVQYIEKVWHVAGEHWFTDEELVGFYEERVGCALPTPPSGGESE